MSIHINKSTCNNFWSYCIVSKALCAFPIHYRKSTFSLPTLTLSCPHIYQLTDEILIHVLCAEQKPGSYCKRNSISTENEVFKRMNENLYLKLHFLLNIEFPKNRMTPNIRWPLISVCMYFSARRLLLTSSPHPPSHSSLIYLLHVASFNQVFHLTFLDLSSLLLHISTHPTFR